MCVRACVKVNTSYSILMKCKHDIQWELLHVNKPMRLRSFPYFLNGKKTILSTLLFYNQEKRRLRNILISTMRSGRPRCMMDGNIQTEVNLHILLPGSSTPLRILLFLRYLQCPTSVMCCSVAARRMNAIKKTVQHK